MVKTYGPNRDSADRVNLNKSGWPPGEVSSSDIRDLLEFSTDWVEALGWRDRPEVTVDSLYRACLDIGKRHGYRINHDRDQVQCICGSPPPCADFEIMRVLMTVLDIEGPLGNGLALAKVQLDAANMRLRQQTERDQREIARLRAELAVKEDQRWETQFRLVNRKLAQEQVKSDDLSRLVRAFAWRSIRQHRKIRALLEPGTET